MTNRQSAALKGGFEPPAGSPGVRRRRRDFEGLAVSKRSLSVGGLPGAERVFLLTLVLLTKLATFLIPKDFVIEELDLDRCRSTSKEPSSMPYAVEPFLALGVALTSSYSSKAGVDAWRGVEGAESCQSSRPLLL